MASDLMACPYCSEVSTEEKSTGHVNFPISLECTCCGLRGPHARTVYGAARAWNALPRKEKPRRASALYLTTHVLPGTDITEAAFAAHALADRLGVDVEYAFVSGIPQRVSPTPRIIQNAEPQEV